MSTELIHLILGAILNLLVAVTIVRFIYYAVTQDKNYVFTFLAFNTIIYFVMGLLSSVEIGVGVGFGLFAIFSVLRYRTEEMSTREMTYLFIVIALPVMNSILISNTDYAQMLIANGTVVTLLFILEKGWGFQYETSKKITYDRIEWITPAHRDQLLNDLHQRTGIRIKRVEVGRIDFLHDTAELKIFYDEPRTLGTSAQSILQADSPDAFITSDLSMGR